MGSATSYLSVVDNGPSASGKTHTWAIYNSQNESFLGIVKWHGPWRKYCFFCAPTLLLEEKCMREIADLIEERTREHRDSQNDS